MKPVKLFCVTSPKLAMCLLLLFGIALSASMAFAQNYREIDINDLGYSVDVPGVVLNAGQSVDVIVNVGKANRPAHDAVGYKIWLQVSSNAQLPNSISPSAQYGWLWEAGSYLGSAKTNDVYNHVYSRMTKENGWGEVLRVQVTAAVNGVWAPSLVQSVGGILIMDNVNIKPDEEVRLSVWPNPCGEFANIDLSGTQLAKVEVIDIQGQLVKSQGALFVVDLSNLAPGNYFIAATDTKGAVYRSRISKF